MEDFKKQLIVRIKQLRKNKKWTQEDLAEKIGLHSTYISRIELGKQFPSLEVLLKISQTFETDITELFFYKEHHKT